MCAFSTLLNAESETLRIAAGIREALHDKALGDNAYSLGTQEPRLELVVCEPTPTFMLHQDAACCIWLKARLRASALANW
jgi:hypothetical protein